MAKMDIKVLNKSENTLTVEISNITSIQINTIRRAIIDYVPTMAIEDVEIKSNSSILYDEIIAHRLGLLPLSTDLKSYNVPRKCTCAGEGCAKCQLSMTLKAKGPKTVHASDIKTKDPKVLPVYPKTPIVTLSEGQSIEVLATAVLGLGKSHAKWSPGMVWYTFSPIIKVDNSSKKMDEFQSKYPKQIFDKKGAIDKDLINTPELLDACEGICDDIVKIEYANGSFILYIESWGQLSPKQMLLEAVSVIDEKCDEFLKELKKI